MEHQRQAPEPQLWPAQPALSHAGHFPRTQLAQLVVLQRQAGNAAVSSYLQRSAAAALFDPQSSDVDLAEAGISGPATGLPHREELEERLRTPLGEVRAHTDSVAAAASRALGARAYAYGGAVAFAEAEPSRRTVAHEVAHLGQTNQLEVGGSGEQDTERDAESVADTAMWGGQLKARKSGASSPADRPLLLTEGERQQLSGTATLLLGGLGLALRALGFSVTGGAVGFRRSVTASAGIGGSVGMDDILFVDPVRWSVTGDVVPYAELGFGLQGGESVGVVLAVRLSPLSRPVGEARDAYEGGSVGGSIRALGGIGLSVGTSLLQGGEGWAGVVITAGAQAGVAGSYAYGVSLTNLGVRVGAIIDGVLAQVGAAGMVGSSVSSAVQQMFRSLFMIFDPVAWDLTGYSAPERAAWLRFGEYMRQAIQGTTLDRFLAEESHTPPVPISRRIASVGDVGVFIAVSEAMRARFRRRMAEAGAPPVSVEVWPANWFNDHGYLQFLQYATENRLLGTKGGGSTTFGAGPAAP